MPNPKKIPPNPHNLPSVYQAGGFFGKLFFLAFLVGAGFFGFYAYKLDGEVIKKFESRRWDIPARVYSRPLTLQRDAPIDKNDVDNWLTLLHYSQDESGKAGSYHINKKDTYTIHTRGFHYGDDDYEAPYTLTISFSNKKIDIIKSEPANLSGIHRLEPIAIGKIYPESNEDRELIKLEDTPKQLIDALIATEDRGFYEHHGVSIRGTARAILNNLKGGSMQGGSTLTQQLIKNFYLTNERSLKRKAQEAVMAMLLELHYDKNDILQVYINEINLGQNGQHSVNGFGVAAQYYFNRPLNELSLDQYALLVGLAKGSSYYNPRKHPERALTRRNIVLDNMYNQGKINQSDYEQARAKPLTVSDKPAIAEQKFPDYMDYVRRELNARYRAEDLQRSGLRIISTLDPLAQIAADKTVSEGLPKLGEGLQGALVAADPTSGQVVALVGSRSDFTGFNRAIDAKRQVGSLLKPIIYLMALQSAEYNLASSVDDSPIAYKVGGKSWTPKNYGGTSHGTVPLMTALANSYNQAAVNTGMTVGLEHYINYLKKMGIKDNIPNYPSVLLGAVDMSPMQVLGIYQAFASGGYHFPLHGIDTVINEKGQILQKAGEVARPRLPEDATYLTNFAMQKVLTEGTAKAQKALAEKYQLAGKTGTTNDARDAWFAGYSGNYVAVVWVGKDDNKPIKLTGGSGALPIWASFMRQLNLTPVNLTKPDNVEWGWLEEGTGRATTESCSGAIYVPILPKSIPAGDSHCLAEQKESERQAELAIKHRAETVSFDDYDESESSISEPANDTIEEFVTGDEFN